MPPPSEVLTHQGEAVPPVREARQASRRWRIGADEAWFLLGLLLAVAASFGGLMELVQRWYRQEEYSHGFFIPLISAWLLWTRRDALAASRGEPSGWGLVVIAAGGLMLLVGEFSAIFILIQVAFLLLVIGLVLCYGGGSSLRLALLPIALLLFAIPMPYFMESQLTWRLQLVSSSLGVGVLRLLDYSVYLEGNMIDLGSYKLQVVEACSGLRYLYPLLSVGFLMAYMYPAALRWRALVVLSTVPVTVLTNSVRIAIVGVLVERWGPGMADGFLHAFEGWIIFIVCQLVLMLEIVLIERYTRRRRLVDVQQFPVVPAVPPSGRGPLPALRMLAMGATVILGVLLAAQVVSGREEVRPERSSLRLFPTSLDDWRSTESSLPADVERALGFQDYMLADYVSSAGDRVNFYVAYYESQRKGVSPHSPQVCIPGGGWVISDLQTVRFSLADGKPMDAMRVLIDKGGERALVYYWFEQRGRRISSEYLMKWYLLLDAVTRNRTDGALVRAVTPVGRNEDVSAADERITRLVRLAVPQMKPFVPN